VLAKNSSFGFFGSVILRVGKKPNVLFVRWLFNLFLFHLVANCLLLLCLLHLAVTVVVSFVADFWLFHFQAATNFMRAANVEFASAPAIKFTTCYLLGLVFSDIRTP
jgi:hypothetical protein